MWSKVIFGHPKWPKSDFQNDRRRPFWKKIKTRKLRIYLKWREMRSKVIFDHPKWTPAAILRQNFKKIKVAYWSEMARNAIESHFRSSKMAAGGHFVNKFKKKVPYWSEMERNTIESDFRSSKMAAGDHFVKTFLKKLKLRIDLKWREMLSKVIFILWTKYQKKIKVAYWSEMARNAIESDFRSSKMATRLLVWWKPFIEMLVH